MIDLDVDFLRSYAQTNPDPWGTSQPHNAYIETSLALRLIVGHETRLEGGQIMPQSVFHQSVKESPTQLESPEYMITMDIIKQSFGSGFTPQYPALNEFEQYCKDHWGGAVRRPLSLLSSAVNIVVGGRSASWCRRSLDRYPTGMGDQRSLSLAGLSRLTRCSSQMSLANGFIPLSTIMGGRETQGEPLYIARARYQVSGTVAPITGRADVCSWH